MGGSKSSLPPGRSVAPLSNQQQMTVSSQFLSLDQEIPARYDEQCRSHFEVIEEEGQKVGVVFFGPDIYPGRGDTLDPNSTLPMPAAVAHEATHFHRWQDGHQFNEAGLEFLDEAQTSAESIVRWNRRLRDHEMTELVRDVSYRIDMFRKAIVAAADAGMTVREFLEASPDREVR